MFFEPRAILLAGWFISTVYAKAKSANNSLYPVSSYQLSVRRLLILGTFILTRKPTIPIDSRQSHYSKRYSHVTVQSLYL